MASLIHKLYHGELHPEEWNDDDSVRSEVLNDAFARNRERLMEALEGNAKAWLEELLQVHDELLGDAAYEEFHKGFVRGGQIVLEICDVNGARN